MSSKHEEHPFKEWLSDNLRYLVLIVCIALGIVAIASGVRVYQSFHRQSAAKDEQSTDQMITIISQGESESGVTVSRQTVRKEPETEKETPKNRRRRKQRNRPKNRQRRKQRNRPKNRRRRKQRNRPKNRRRRKQKSRLRSRQRRKQRNRPKSRQKHKSRPKRLTP